MSKGDKGDTVPSAENARPNRPKRDQIGDSLRRVYDDMLDDDVPDRFEDLLRQLREQDEK